MSYFVDGVSIDYPPTMNRGDGLDLGQIQCCRADHLIQEAVDPDTGEPQAVRRKVRFPGGQVELVREWREGYSDDGDEIPPKHSGMCQACWIEQRDPERVNCTLHGNNRRVAGVEGCPICGLDPLEKKRAVAYERKIAEVNAINAADDDPITNPTPALVLVPGDGAERAAALARRRAARIVVVAR